MRRSRRRRHPMLRRIRQLRRSPVGYWTAALLVAASTATVVYNLTARAETALHAWGDVKRVAVATVALEPGDVVGPGDVTVRDLPAALVPDGALTAPPVGRVVVAPIYAREPIVAERLAPDGLSGVAALLPAGTRALAVVAAAGMPPLTVGDRVDVLATFDPSVSAAGGGEPTFAVAERALVVAVDDAAVTVAVDAPDAPRVAFALAQGQVTLALSGTR